MKASDLDRLAKELREEAVRLDEEAAKVDRETEDANRAHAESIDKIDEALKTLRRYSGRNPA